MDVGTREKDGVLGLMGFEGPGECRVSDRL